MNPYLGLLRALNNHLRDLIGASFVTSVKQGYIVDHKSLMVTFDFRGPGLQPRDIPTTSWDTQQTSVHVPHPTWKRSCLMCQVGAWAVLDSGGLDIRILVKQGSVRPQKWYISSLYC